MNRTDDSIPEFEGSFLFHITPPYPSSLKVTVNVDEMARRLRFRGLNKLLRAARRQQMNREQENLRREVAMDTLLIGLIAIAVAIPLGVFFGLRRK